MSGTSQQTHFKGWHALLSLICSSKFRSCCRCQSRGPCSRNWQLKKKAGVLPCSLIDLCMLDELAMRLRVQGGMRWSPGTATRLGRVQSVIRSLLAAPCNNVLIILPSIISHGNRRCWKQFRSNERDVEWSAGGATCHSSPVSNPVLLKR